MAIAPTRGSPVPFHPQPMLLRLFALALLLASALLLAGCGRASVRPSLPLVAAAPQASSAKPPPVEPGSETPDPDRAMAHLRALAAEIGVRASTTDGERRAAEYLKAQFEAAGYQVAIESFEVDTPIRRTGGVLLPDGVVVLAAPFGGSADGEGSGPIVLGGLGRAPELAAAGATGAVVVVDRGAVLFAEKAHAAQDAGAVALVVVNNQPGPFNGDLNTAGIRIPVLGAAQEDGQTLRALAGQTVSVRSESIRLRGRSQNVFARPTAAPCTAYLGAHYDSVPVGPGAEDNASGTSLLVELARARRTDGVCVVAFGSEEVGLLGSKAFVRTHNVKDARFMLNFDMVAKLSRPAFIGDRDLAARATTIARAHGLEVPHTTSVGPNASSDHASFAAESVPALMFYAGDDPFIHSARDSVENVRRDDLARFLDIAAELMDALAAR